MSDPKCSHGVTKTKIVKLSGTFWLPSESCDECRKADEEAEKAIDEFLARMAERKRNEKV